MKSHRLAIFLIWVIALSACAVKPTIPNAASRDAASPTVMPKVSIQEDTTNEVDIKKREDVYAWDRLETARYDPRDEFYDENLKVDFVEAYLREHSIYKGIQDGAVYGQDGLPLVEYYINKEKCTVSFVVHIWNNYLVDGETQASKYIDAVYCTTLNWDDSKRIGSLAYECDVEQNITNEVLYDTAGNNLASVSYTYSTGVPFPLIVAFMNADIHDETIGETLCRGQKFWFYNEFTVYDEMGRLSGYDRDLFNASNPTNLETHLNKCQYDSNNRLQSIEEELLAEDINWGWLYAHSAEIALSYTENGILNMVDYFCSSYTHGTWDSSGKIFYDAMGRMVENRYYVTHGGQKRIYLYDGESLNPWACLYWDSFIPGFEKIYLFLPH